MAPSRPLPTGSASVQTLAGFLYHSFKLFWQKPKKGTSVNSTAINLLFIKIIVLKRYVSAIFAQLTLTAQPRASEVSGGSFCCMIQHLPFSKDLLLPLYL
jgi:hypothetical protein